MPRPFIKICGQTEQHAIDHALSLGVDALGFIFHEKSPRSMSPQQAASLHTGCSLRVGVFVQQEGMSIRAMMDAARLDLAQLHGAQTRADAELIGCSRVIRVLWPDRYPAPDAPKSLQADIDHWAQHCAYYLLDAGQDGGGHGCTLRAAHLLAQLRFPRPWILAGGLNAQNAGSLYEQYCPYGLDLNSGLESSPGVKDAGKVSALFAQFA